LFSGKSNSVSFFTQSHISLFQQFSQITPPINLKNSGPSMTKAVLSFLSVIIPTFLAIAQAVILLSPVTIFT